MPAAAAAEQGTPKAAEAVMKMRQAEALAWSAANPTQATPAGLPVVMTTPTDSRSKAGQGLPGTRSRARCTRRVHHLKA